jgi:hypothetical protein
MDICNLNNFISSTTDGQLVGILGRRTPFLIALSDQRFFFINHVSHRESGMNIGRGFGWAKFYRWMASLDHERETRSKQDCHWESCGKLRNVVKNCDGSQFQKGQ